MIRFVNLEHRLSRLDILTTTHTLTINASYQTLIDDISRTPSSDPFNTNLLHLCRYRLWMTTILVSLTKSVSKPIDYVALPSFDETSRVSGWSDYEEVVWRQSCCLDAIVKAHAATDLYGLKDVMVSLYQAKAVLSSLQVS